MIIIDLKDLCYTERVQNFALWARGVLQTCAEREVLGMHGFVALLRQVGIRDRTGRKHE